MSENNIFVHSLSPGGDTAHIINGKLTIYSLFGGGWFESDVLPDGSKFVDVAILDGGIYAVGISKIVYLFGGGMPLWILEPGNKDDVTSIWADSSRPNVLICETSQKKYFRIDYDKSPVWTDLPPTFSLAEGTWGYKAVAKDWLYNIVRAQYHTVDENKETGPIVQTVVRLNSLPNGGNRINPGQILRMPMKVTVKQLDTGKKRAVSKTTSK